MSQIEYEDVDQLDDDKEDEEQYVAVEEDPNKGQNDSANDGDDENDEETRLGGGREDDDDDDKERAERREKRKSRKRMQREARDRNERELRFLRNRNEQLERRFSELEQEVDARVTGSEVASVDNAINKAKSDLQLANQVIQQAVEANNGADLAEALDHRDAIRDQLRDLDEAKTYLGDERRQQGNAQNPPRVIDPRVAAHAQQFIVDHDWWDPQGTDDDSRRVLQLDHALVAEGYSPQTKEYWDELRARVKNEFPQHFGTSSRDDEDDDDGGDDVDDGDDRQKQENQQRQRGPQFRTGGRERSLKKNEVYISQERREAMEEAGVWDDPVLRNRYLKAYAEYDQDQQGAQ